MILLEVIYSLHPVIFLSMLDLISLKNKFMLNQPEIYIAIDFTPFANNTQYLHSFLMKWHEVFENNYSNPEWYGTL